MNGSTRPRSTSRRGSARGFTLIETALTTVIIGVGVVAIVEAQQAFMRSNGWSSEAATAAVEDGHDLEVIDLRTLSPLDLGPVVASVRRTGRLVVVAEAPSEASVASEVAARVQEECFHSLEAPVLRVTGFDTPYPPSKCEEDYIPDLDRVLDAVDRSLAW